MIVLILAGVILVAGAGYLVISRVSQKIKATQDRLVELATIDDLTQLHNRRYFFARFQQEMERSRRYRRPLSCLILDIDNFKHVNDTYGHLAGDQVLVDIARIVKSNCRQSDLAGRYGGEELIILLPETKAAGAVAIAERIREVVERHETVDGKGNLIRVTVSIGVASLEGADFNGLNKDERIIQFADDALLLAKKKGRNRIQFYRPAGAGEAREHIQGEAAPAPGNN